MSPILPHRHKCTQCCPRKSFVMVPNNLRMIRNFPKISLKWVKIPPNGLYIPICVLKRLKSLKKIPTNGPETPLKMSPMSPLTPNIPKMTQTSPMVPQNAPNSPKEFPKSPKLCKMPPKNATKVPF